MKFFEWHANSCYIDTLLYCIFSEPFNILFDDLLKNIKSIHKKYKYILNLLRAISKLLKNNNEKEYPTEYYESYTSLITELRYAIAETNDACRSFKPAENLEEKKKEMNDPHEFLQHVFFDLLDIPPFIECVNTIYLPHSCKSPSDRIVIPISIHGKKYIHYNHQKEYRHVIEIHELGCMNKAIQKEFTFREEGEINVCEDEIVQGSGLSIIHYKKYLQCDEEKTRMDNNEKEKKLFHFAKRMERIKIKKKLQIILLYYIKEDNVLIKKKPNLYKEK